MRKALIDGDVLVYEVGFGVEAGWEKEGNEGSPPFHLVENAIRTKIDYILKDAEAEDPTIYLTGSSNFRTQIAVTTPYKERAGAKPYHYKNIRNFLKFAYETKIVEGLEADDLMAMDQTDDTIICTRDKDLRQVAGWHYGWETGKQPSFGPKQITELGYLEMKKGKLRGGGELFFYAQCITGDSVDSIPGLPDYGPAKAFKLLTGCPSTQEAFNRVLGLYKEVVGANAEAYLLEQGRLLRMVRKLNEDGTPQLWEFPHNEE